MMKTLTMVTGAALAACVGMLAWLAREWGTVGYGLNPVVSVVVAAVLAYACGVLAGSDSAQGDDDAH